MKALLACIPVAFAASASAQEVRPVPPPGIEVPAADRAEIEAGIAKLAEALAPLKRNASLAGEVPNVEIYHKAADWALRHNEIFDKKQIPAAKAQLEEGLERATALAKGTMPWNAQTGMVLRAYRSKIDGSVQPYALHVPENWGKQGANVLFPLHFWCHGRNEKLSELAFIESARKPGEFTPPGAIVCYLYGRFCNANKFAGEMDLFEALDDIKKHYPIDERRMVIRGFSMGGAACWQFATHHSGMWAAAAPGAGFAETAEFFKVFAPGKEAPPAWEQKLWRWYDCTTMAANLANTSVVAYSGEVDGQKQAADIMVKYAAQEGITFPHIIGAKMGHKYDDASKAEIEKLVTAAVEKGNDPFPKKVRLVTYSLLYPNAEWVTITAMEKQWERAEVNAELKDDTAHVSTRNVATLVLSLRGSGNLQGAKAVVVDGKEFTHPNRIHWIALRKQAGAWELAGITHSDGKGGATGFAQGLPADGRGGKTPSVCGPIDHAFMSKFVFVRPTGKPLNDEIGAWAMAEMRRAIAQWRQVFRGDAAVVDDTAVTDALAKDANLVLWGDVSSNRVIAKISDKLPLKWDATTLALGTQKVDAAHHAPILIYPNPLNPSRYVVLNSGPTFREAAALNNSDQTPKLPDWAVVDLRTPPGPKWPGRIVDAGFFDEHWK